MNRKGSILFVFILLSVALSAQQTKAIEFIWKGKYENAQKIIDKALTKNIDDVEFNFYKAYLLFQREFEGYDPVESYKCLLNADTEYANLDEKTKEKLQSIPLNHEMFMKYVDTVCSYALKDAIKSGTYEAFQNYIFFYREASEEYRNEAKMYRNIEAYKIAIAKNTEEAYAGFISAYPDAQQISDATKRRNEKAFETAQAESTVESYEKFIEKYPDAEQFSKAQEQVYILALANAEKENTSAALKNYMQKYPHSTLFYKAEMMYDEKLYNEETTSADCKSYIKFVKKYPENKWNSMALATAIQCAENAKDIEVIKYCYQNLKGDKKSQALDLYYEMVTSDGEMITLTTLYSDLDANLRQLIRTKYVADSAVASMGNKLKIYNGYNPKKLAQYDEYIKMAAPKEKAFVALQKIMEADIQAKKWASATATLLKYYPYWKGNSEKLDELKAIFDSKTEPVTATSLSANLNTSGNEYNPILTSDESTLFFCGEGRTDNIKGEDIFVAEKTEEGWGAAKIIAEVSGNANDYPESVNVSGNALYIFKNGRIYFSKKAGATWGKPQKMSSNVNSCSWQGDVFLSPDGKALFFSAKRKDMLNLFNDMDYEGLDYHGKIDELQTDIYVCTIDEEGQWGTPINLGSSINTLYTERTPFMHSDMRHLYFASDGHGGLGGLDMYVSTRLRDDCWDCWSKPMNLGKEINTTKDDMGYKISKDGTTAYFSKLETEKSKKGNFDIFFITLPDHLRPQNIK